MLYLTKGKKIMGEKCE